MMIDKIEATVLPAVTLVSVAYIVLAECSKLWGSEYVILTELREELTDGYETSSESSVTTHRVHRIGSVSSSGSVDSMTKHIPSDAMDREIEVIGATHDDVDMSLMEEGTL
jgi:hypothetical protein